MHPHEDQQRDTQLVQNTHTHTHTHTHIYIYIWTSVTLTMSRPDLDSNKIDVTAHCCHISLTGVSMEVILSLILGDFIAKSSVE